MSWLKWWAGIVTAIMETPEVEIPSTSSKDVEPIREFLAWFRASIIMDEKPKILRENDSYIMDHVIRSEMNRTDMYMVNKTRLYLQVETVAEISNPEGTRINPAWMQDGNKPSWSTSKRPKVGKPSKNMWRS